MLEAKREREKRAALAAGDAPKEPSEHERKLDTGVPTWILAMEKATLEVAWNRWLQNIAKDVAAEKAVRE